MVIAVHFFCHPQFPNKQNSLFGVMLALAMLDIIFDILSSVVIDNVLTVPLPYTQIVCSLFYLMQNLFGALMALYIMMITGRYEKGKKRRLLLMAIPAAFSELLLLSNSITRHIFYVDPVRGYIHGPLFILQHMAVGLYILYSFILINVYRVRIRKSYYWTITALLAVIVAALVVQVLFPQMLLTSVAIALAITMMYLVMQKPEGMLDATTGAFNYAAMQIFLQDCIEEKQSCSITVIRLDNLSSINWSFGLMRGNQVLCLVSDYLRRAAGRGCWVFRMSGMRFAVTTPSQKAHRRMLDDIHARMSGQWDVDGMKLNLESTVLDLDDTGVFASANDVLALLSNEMLNETHSGFVDLDRVMLGVAYRRYEIETILSEALENGTLEVFFQPIYDEKKRSFHTAEALVRLPHNGDYISPTEFIPIAERNENISRVDDFVLRRVCAFLRSQQQGEDYGLNSVEVNLSAAEFLYDDLRERVVSIVSEYGISPAQILFEITETVASSEYDTVKQVMEELQALGFRFVLDDYGTGYSNIAKVAQLPFMAAKLDRSMLLAREQNRQNEIAFRHTLLMFREMGLITVAEGVEYEEQAELLRSLEIDYIQGFLYARPMPEQELIRFLKAEAAV